MKNFKEWIKNHKVLSGVIGVLLVIILVSSCSNEEAEEYVGDKTQEKEYSIYEPEKDGYISDSDGYNDYSEEEDKNVEEKKEDEEVAEEQKEEAEEDVDTYVNNNPNPSVASLDTVNEAVEYIYESNFTYSQGYRVDLDVNGNQVNVVILCTQLDSSGLSDSEMEYALIQSGLPTAFDGLATQTRDVYAESGYDMSVNIKLYDVNGTLIYETNAY